MGLERIGGALGAGIGALGGVLADTWKDYFVCDTMGADELVKKGEQNQGRRGVNRKGSDNLITTGSVIVVAEGQCMLIADQGKIVEFCAEPGAFTYDASTEPSLFCGEWKPGVSRKTYWQSPLVTTPIMRFLVVWGRLVAMAIFAPTMLFKRVDFPTFGMPTIAAKTLVVFSMAPCSQQKKARRSVRRALA